MVAWGSLAIDMAITPQFSEDAVFLDAASMVGVLTTVGSLACAPRKLEPSRISPSKAISRARIAAGGNGKPIAWTVLDMMASSLEFRRIFGTIDENNSTDHPSRNRFLFSAERSAEDRRGGHWLR